MKPRIKLIDRRNQYEEKRQRLSAILSKMNNGLSDFDRQMITLEKLKRIVGGEDFDFYMSYVKGFKSGL